MGKNKTKHVFVGDVGSCNIHQRIPEEFFLPMCRIIGIALTVDPCVAQELSPAPLKQGQAYI